MNKFFRLIFVPLLMNTTINVSKISASKCTFFYYFNWCFIWAKIHIYNTPLSYVTELFNFFNASFLLILINKHLKIVSFALNIAIFFKEWAFVNKSWRLLQTCSSNLNPISLKNQQWQSSHSFDASSVSIEVNRTVFIFFYKRYFKRQKHKQKHLS